MTIAQAYESALGHYQADRLQDAERLLRQVLSVQPDHADALHLLGVIGHRVGRTADAIELLRRAIPIHPASSEFHNNLALMLASQGEIEEAIIHARRAIELRPEFVQAHNCLGTLFSEQLQWDLAAESFRTAVSLHPQYAQAWANLGNVLKNSGELDEAIACYRRASDLKPDPRIQSNLLYLLYFHPDYDARRIAQAHSEWNRSVAMPLLDTSRRHHNDPSPDRRLRVGYVSPDFRQHAVGRFLAPLLAHHDHRQFEIHCYSDVTAPDGVTWRLRGYADAWHDTCALPDEALAQVIRDQQIDIFIDLTMHMEGGRLLTFARKPAPVQLTYLAYSGTTGLGAMDYRLTDRYLDPPGTDESVYSETLVRLQSYWCYEAPAEAPPVGHSPFASQGIVTFGCQNNFSKVTQPTLDVWRQILKSVPNSRLILHSGEGSHRQRVSRQFESDGIATDRLQFVSRLPVDDYFEQWGRIDIALDPFPYPGGTTTCDALWMGVPVISLAGQTSVSRAGLSILSAIGLSELVAKTSRQYIQIGTDLATDVERLQQLRASLRQRMLASPLMDPLSHARDIEAAYRTMWRNWCGRTPG